MRAVIAGVELAQRRLDDEAAIVILRQPPELALEAFAPGADAAVQVAEGFAFEANTQRVRAVERHCVIALS